MTGIAEGAAAKFFPRLPRTDVEEIGNNAIHAIYAQVCGLETPIDFISRLATIAVRLALKRYEYLHAQMRDCNKESHIEETEEREREDRDYLRDESQDAVRVAERNEIAEFLQPGLSALDERDRQVLLLYSYGCRPAEIADILDLRGKPASDRLDEAVGRLRNILKKQGQWQKLMDYKHEYHHA